MKCEFSETQYMFGVMRELAARLKPSGGWMAPLFPTQNDEKNLGYDCAFPGKVRTLYLQFKVPEKKTRSNAAHWSDFSTSYYQFKIWDASRTDQHNLLVSLAQKDPRYRVYYCSPAFISQTDYTNFYLTERIARNSIFVPCKTLPKISGNDQHHICYTRDPEKYRMYSNPQVIRGMEWETFLSEVRKSEPYPSSKSCFQFGSPNCRKASNHAGLRASSNCELGSVLSCCSSQFPRLEFCGKMAIMRAAI